ncbi:MAG: DUF928 domain-containing protein [Leptolyngbyaceae cyanobacterium bins.349]|nr:DUF928 domain-containing protein [Leptolyngbyaceae cyanobacterium bins.349]
MRTHLNRQWICLLSIAALSSLAAFPGMAKTPTPPASNRTTPRTLQQRRTPSQPTPNRSMPAVPRGQSAARSFAFEGKGSPASTVAGGRRSNGLCQAASNNSPLQASSSLPTAAAPDYTQTLTVLVPTQGFDGGVASDRPTFLVYVPQNSARELSFRLKDSDDNDIYQTQVPLTGSPQIVGIQMPEPLKVGQTYQWLATLICSNNTVAANNPYVKVKIQRVQPDREIASQLQQAHSLEQVAAYARASLWYEASTALVALKQANPQNAEYTTAWNELLQSIGLDKLTTVPATIK